MNNRTLILDFNNMLYRGIAVHPELSYKGVYTGGLYGFTIQLASLLGKYDPKTLVVCSDSKPYLRAQEYPEYKARRKKEVDPNKEAQKAIARVQCEALLEMVGIPFWEIQGLEADDLIYHACERCIGSERVIIVSNDDDLNQLFFTFENIEMDRSGRAYTEDMFIREYGDWSIRDYLHYLAIKGTHNGIPGLHGFGAKKARNIIEKGLVQKYKEQHKEICLFYSLIKLPYKAPLKLEKEIERLPMRATKKQTQEAMRMLHNHGIKITPQINNSFRRWQEQ